MKYIPIQSKGIWNRSIILWYFLFLLSGCNNSTPHGCLLNQPYDSILQTTLDLIYKDYVENPDETKMAEGLINGILNNLDPNSGYYNPKDFKHLVGFTEGNFFGVGLEIIPADAGIRIITPIDDTPAQKAGIKAGDIIVKIDDKDITNLPYWESVKLLQGKVGTFVKVTILREKLINFNLQRTNIMTSGVRFTFKDDIAYLRISAFTTHTLGKIKECIGKIKRKPDCKGLIIDVRNNPGGILEQGVEVTSLFIEKGIVVDVRGRSVNYSKKHMAMGEDQLKGIPIVVLVNNGSASAAEIFAGALKDYKRAIIIGEKTFGKGSVQAIFSIPEHNCGIKLTVAHFYTPHGHSIQNHGISPDIIVRAQKNKMLMYSLDNKEDMQLQRAIMVLKGSKL